MNTLGTRLNARRALLAVSALAAGLFVAAPILPASAAAPTITEYPLAVTGSIPRESAAGPDGNVWFTEYNYSRIGRIKPDGSLFEVKMPSTNSTPRGIATGPDGALWFTEVNVNKIGRMTTAAVFTEYTLPRANTQPFSIAAGPDGNMWFTELGYGSIGQITPTGVVTEFPIPYGVKASLRGITAGPDGNMWFVEQDANQIGSITMSGVVTEYLVPTAGSGPRYIATGPDGNIWFTEVNGLKIGRMTTAGVFTEFPTNSANRFPLSINAGSDGNMWFTQQGHASTVARMTMAGVMAELSVPTLDSQPGGLSLGPDGNIWFTEQAASKIGRVSIAHSGTSYVLANAAGFSPSLSVVSQGTDVRWTLQGPGLQSVTDGTSLKLFDTGPKNHISYFDFRFNAAGSYPYSNTVTPSQTGLIAVPVLAAPSSGLATAQYTITFAAAPLPSGFVADVVVKRPGTTVFSPWLTGLTGTNVVITPDAGPGTYQFQARFRNSLGGVQSGFSPAATIVTT